MEALAAWKTGRLKRPVLILGKLEGVETGIRQLRRAGPLETEMVEGIRVPTLPEMLRTKAWLVITRNKTRDYLDVAALSHRLGDPDAVRALDRLDALYPQSSGESPLRQLAKQLAEPKPDDLEALDLAHYWDLVSPWNSWDHVQKVCLHLSDVLAEHLLGPTSR